jgi:hypothetical protein
MRIERLPVMKELRLGNQAMKNLPIAGGRRKSRWRNASKNQRSTACLRATPNTSG